MDQPAQAIAEAQDLPWWRIWLLAITRPSLATYERIATQPNATRRRALKWIGSVTGVQAGIGVIYGVLLSTVFRGPYVAYAMQTMCAQNPMLCQSGTPNPTLQMYEGIYSNLGFFAACGALVSPVIVILAFLAWTELVSLATGWLGNKANSTTLAFTFAAFVSPVSAGSYAINMCSAILVLAGGVILGPRASGLASLYSVCASGFGCLLLIFQITLSVFAIRGVNKMDTGNAIGASLIGSGIMLVTGIVIYCGLVACIGLAVWLYFVRG